MAGNGKHENEGIWDSAAPGWARWESALMGAATEATEQMLDAANVEAGMRVLDLACGAGSQTIQAARRVGPTGRVFANDIASKMLTFRDLKCRRRGADQCRNAARPSGRPFRKRTARRCGNLPARPDAVPVASRRARGRAKRLGGKRALRSACGCLAARQPAVFKNHDDRTKACREDTAAAGLTWAVCIVRSCETRELVSSGRVYRHQDRAGRRPIVHRFGRRRANYDEGSIWCLSRRAGRSGRRKTRCGLERNWRLHRTIFGPRQRRCGYDLPAGFRGKLANLMIQISRPAKRRSLSTPNSVVFAAWRSPLWARSRHPLHPQPRSAVPDKPATQQGTAPASGRYHFAVKQEANSMTSAGGSVRVDWRRRSFRKSATDGSERY